MEILRLVVLLWGSIGILACVMALYFFSRCHKRDPDFFTNQACASDTSKAGKFISIFLGGFILYNILFVLITAYIAYGTIPTALCLFGVIGIAILLMLFISLKK